MGLFCSVLSYLTYENLHWSLWDSDVGGSVCPGNAEFYTNGIKDTWVLAHPSGSPRAYEKDLKRQTWRRRGRERTDQLSVCQAL